MHRLPTHRAQTTVAVAVWVALIAVAVAWGHHLLPGGSLNEAAPPFLGRYRFLPSAVVLPAAYAAVVVALLPPIVARMRWRPLLLLSWAMTVGWTLLLAARDGHHSIGQPLYRRSEYLWVLPRVGDDPLGWLRGFVDHLHEYPVHVKGHPPLMVLVFWAWSRLGDEGGNWASVLVIAAGTSALVAAAVTLRLLAGESVARAALPFLVLAPYVITVASSADAFYTGVAAWCVAAVAIGVHRRAPGWLFIGGLLGGALPYLNYGLLPFGLVPVVAGWLAWRRTRRRLRLLEALALVVGLLLPAALFTAGGFWWPDGVAATHRAWIAGRGDNRPYAYSFVGDLAVLAVLTGPATAAGLASLRRRRVSPLTLLVSAALAAVLVLDASGVTRLEVERIWLPFAPWVLAACAALRGNTRRWLAVNASCALVFTLFVYELW